MKKIRLAIALTALLALALPGVASATDKLDPVQWDIGASSLTGGRYYTLKNDINKSTLGYGSRTFGVDLTWNSAGKWEFLRKSTSPNVRDHRTPPPGEPVALYNTAKRQYLNYGSQTWGINLTWSKTPSYQWKVEFGASGKMSLYNTSAGDHVVYGERSQGINLRWLRDLKKIEAQNGIGSIHDASVTLTSQPPVSGYIPFAGTYGGGGTKAVLTKVTNPWGTVQVNFIKPGYSSSQCGVAGATLPLGPKQTLTADQMKTLWGSSTPSLAQPVPFVACVASSNSLSAVVINVQYRTTG